MDDGHFLPPGKHIQEGPILLVFVVLLLLMATNVLVIFVLYNKTGYHFLLILNSLYSFLTS